MSNSPRSTSNHCHEHEWIDSEHHLLTRNIFLPFNRRRKSRSLLDSFLDLLLCQLRRRDLCEQVWLVPRRIDLAGDEVASPHQLLKDVPPLAVIQLGQVVLQHRSPTLVGHKFHSCRIAVPQSSVGNFHWVNVLRSLSWPTIPLFRIHLLSNWHYICTASAYYDFYAFELRVFYGEYI